MGKAEIWTATDKEDIMDRVWEHCLVMSQQTRHDIMLFLRKLYGLRILPGNGSTDKT